MTSPAGRRTPAVPVLRVRTVRTRVFESTGPWSGFLSHADPPEEFSHTVMARDYYEVLEVERTCTEVELKSAFRKAAIKHHPDKNPGDAHGRGALQGVQRGLFDPQRSRRSAPPTIASATPPSRTARAALAAGARLPGRPRRHLLLHLRGRLRRDVWRAAAAQERSGPARGQDLRYDLEITPRSRRSRARRWRSTFPPPTPATPVTGRAPSPAPTPTTCHHLCGPRPRARRAGLLLHRAHLPPLRRPRPGDHRSLPNLPRSGPGAT